MKINTQLFLSLFSTDDLQSYNREIAKEIGLNQAIMLSAMIGIYKSLDKSDSLQGYYISKETTEDVFGMPISDEFRGKVVKCFYYSREKFYDKTALTATQQRTALKDLEERGFVRTLKVGIPAANRYFLDLNKIAQLLGGDINEEHTDIKHVF